MPTKPPPAGTRHSVDSLLHGHGPALTLGVETVDVADAVRVLGVLFTPDLALDKHTSAVSAKCFYQLLRRSLDTDSAKILVHTFMTSQIDYCNGLLANMPSIWTEKLQRVLNAAARMITNTRKFDRGLTSILHDDLHWLDLPRCVLFKICVTVYKSLHGMAPSIWRSCVQAHL